MAVTQRADHGWCINCFLPFAAHAIHCWFGAHQVGPFCEACDRIIKAHTRFKAAS